MNTLFSFIGKAVCHQLPVRSFVSGGQTFPVCARCMGLYTGFLASIIFIIVTRRFNGRKPFSILQSILLTIGFYPMLIDIVTSYAGLRETSNLTRYLTGVLFAYAIPFLFVFIKNFKLTGENNGVILRLHEAVLIIIAAFLPYFLFASIDSVLVYYLGGAIASASIYLVFYCVCFYFTVILFNVKGQAQKLLCAFLPFFIISILSNFNFFFKL